MRERAATIGASLAVSSVPGGGVTVRLDVPYGQ
jgi:signal transduction histidine kinase